MKPARSPYTPTRTVPLVGVGLLLLVLGLCGCRSSQWAQLRRTPSSPLNNQLTVLTDLSGRVPKHSKRTLHIIRANDLEALVKENPRQAIIRLRDSLQRDPSADKLYAMAEIAYVEGRQLEKGKPDLALAMYGAATVYSYEHLFGDHYGKLRNPYDPEFRGSCDLYNGGLEGAMRIARQRGLLRPGRKEMINAADHDLELTVEMHSSRWSPADFERFEFVSDYEITGLANQYQTFGLGVPLMAVRSAARGDRPGDQYSPPGVSVPLTAFLRLPEEDNPCAHLHRAVLELHDPLEAIDITVAKRRVPLQTDLTTPLAYSLDQPSLKNLDSSTDGLLHPDKLKSKGIFMLDPYQPGKIPVLMVHGLWSSPITWMEMFNDLRSQADLRERYQFWFYLYPTAEPFWFSAAKLRADLAELRANIDPQRRDVALDQMVLVGHSMGGLVSRLQTVESGNDFWQTVSTQPLDNVKANDEVRRGLAATFYFHPNDSVKRVVMMGTPHRGSNVSNDFTRYISSKLISLPQMLVMGAQQLRMQNPGMFRSGAPIDIFTSVDSLSPHSPLLPVLLTSQAPANVRYHNILGRVERSGVTKHLLTDGDGVVPYDSAHLDGVDSELVVTADHLHVHRHPLAVLEVRRILLDHLIAAGQPPAGPVPLVRGLLKPTPAGNILNPPALTIPIQEIATRPADPALPATAPVR